MKFIFHIFIFFVFFPYLRPIPIAGTGDTQPYALIIAIIALFFYWRIKANLKVPNEYFYFLIVFFFSFIVFIFSDISVIGLRSLIGYLSLFVISIVSYYLFNKGFTLSDFILKWIIIVWGVVGLVQLFVDVSFMSFLLPRSSSSEVRGVVSLAPEPSYYGIMCLFLLFFSIFQLKSKKYFLFLIFQIVFLSKSTLLILILFLTGMVYLFFYRKYVQLFVIVALVPLIFIPIFSILFPGTRVASLLKSLWEEPDLIFYADVSLNDRLSAIFFSLKGFIEHFGMPSGINTYEAYVVVQPETRTFFDGHISTSKIMSGYGTVLFELGIVGLLIPILYYRAFKHYFILNRRLKWIVFISFSLLMINPVPIALPILGFLFSYLQNKIYYPNNANSTSN